MLTEKYRPRRLSQVVGQAKVCRVLQRILASSDRGAIWLEGATGIGKTSIAGGIAHAIGAKRGDVHKLDGAACDIAAVRELDAEAQRWGNCGWLDSPPTVVVVDEAHAMTSRAVQAWLTLLERIPKGWWIVFSTTEDSTDLFGGFAQPFIDRTVSLRLTNQGLSKVFARLVHRIATREGLNGKPIEEYVKLAKHHHNSCRRMLQEVQKGKMLAE